MIEPAKPDPDIPDAAHPKPLDYASPPAPAPPDAQVILGAILALGIVLTTSFFGPIVTFSATFARIGPWGAGFVLGPLAGVVIVSVIGLLLRRSRRPRAWAAGLWIGVGIAILVHSLCSAVVLVSL